MTSTLPVPNHAQNGAGPETLPIAPLMSSAGRSIVHEWEGQAAAAKELSCSRPSTVGHYPAVEPTRPALRR